MNVQPLRIEDSSGWLPSLKRSATVLVIGTLFEQSITHIFQNPLLSLGGMALCYYFRDVVEQEIKQIHTEYSESSHLSNLVRITFPLLGMTTPLLALKTAPVASHLTYQTISTLSMTAFSALSPVVYRYRMQVDAYFLDRTGMHISNVAQNEILANIQTIGDKETETTVSTTLSLEREIKELQARLKEKGVYVQDGRVITIQEVKE